MVTETQVTFIKRHTSFELIIERYWNFVPLALLTQKLLELKSIGILFGSAESVEVLELRFLKLKY